MYFVWSQKQVILAVPPEALSVFFRLRETERISIYKCCWHKQAGSTQQAGTVWISQRSLAWTVVWNTRGTVDQKFWFWDILLSLAGYLFSVERFAEFIQTLIRSISYQGDHLIFGVRSVTWTCSPGDILAFLEELHWLFTSCWHFILSFQSIWWCHGLDFKPHSFQRVMSEDGLQDIKLHFNWKKYS